MDRACILSIFFLCVSCSSIEYFLPDIKKDRYLSTKKKGIGKNDFLIHFIYLGKDFVNSNKNNSIPLSQKTQSYLKALVGRLVENNRQLYTSNMKLKFHIIENNKPFYFSLPGGSYFYSTGIFKKYIKHEEILMAILSIQTFRTFRNIYEKKTLVPVGYIELEKMIYLTKISLKHKIEINKWAYFTLEKSNLDPSIILNWIQIRNKNILDFTFMDGDRSAISREEFAFKNFVATIEKDELKTNIQRNSSMQFYRFIKNILEKK